MNETSFFLQIKKIQSLYIKTYSIAQNYFLVELTFNRTNTEHENFLKVLSSGKDSGFQIQGFQAVNQ